jgi:hypothetical protein
MSRVPTGYRVLMTVVIIAEWFIGYYSGEMHYLGVWFGH